MQVSVSSYSFAQLNKNPVELIALAKELGFAAIEYTGLELEAAKRVREESDRLDLPIICYTVWADFIKAASLDDEIKRVCEQVDIAEILGVKKMRHDATGGFAAPLDACNSFDQALPVLAKGCRAVTEYAAKKGIATMVENHGYFCQDSSRVASLIGAVNHPNFGALVDVGNFFCADEDSAKATGNLAAMAKHVHAKDFHAKSGSGDNPGEGWFFSRAGNYLRGSIIGHGNVPVRQCLRTLRNAGYDGPVSIEFEGMEDCMTALRIGRQNLEAMLALS